MEALAILALVLSIISVVLAFTIRARADRAALEAGRSEQRWQQAVDGLREEVAAIRRDLDEARAALEAPPPLPRTRTGGLDDLRERLRAAHLEPDADEE